MRRTVRPSVSGAHLKPFIAITTAMYFLFAGDLGRAEQEALRGLEVRTSDSRMSCFSHAHARSWLLGI